MKRQSFRQRLALWLAPELRRTDAQARQEAIGRALEECPEGGVVLDTRTEGGPTRMYSVQLITMPPMPELFERSQGEPKD